MRNTHETPNVLFTILVTTLTAGIAERAAIKAGYLAGPLLDTDFGSGTPVILGLAAGAIAAATRIRSSGGTSQK